MKVLPPFLRLLYEYYQRVADDTSDGLTPHERHPMLNPIWWEVTRLLTCRGCTFYPLLDVFLASPWPVCLLALLSVGRVGTAADRDQIRDTPDARYSRRGG